MRTSRHLKLPRESRDTLLLLVVVGWTILPHAWHVPWWCTLLSAVVLVWRASLALTARPVPSSPVRIIFLALAVGLTWSTYGTVMGKDAGVTLLVMLIVIKTLELRARRDAMVIFFLGFFVIITQFFYSQSLPLAAAMLVSVWGLLTALVLANLHAGHPSLRAAGGVAARMALLSLPVMTVLFVVFPRIGPMWGSEQGGKATTGLSNSMRMGGIAELTKSDQIAFRVKFEGTPPPQSQLYFRGPVLTRFNGREWTATAQPSQPSRHPVVFGGKSMTYQMRLEPNHIHAIPVLEWTSAIDPSPSLQGLEPSLQEDGQWRSQRPVMDRVEFSATAHSAVKLGTMRPDGSLADALVIPEDSNPRTTRWARELLARERELHAGGTPAVIRRLLAHIQQGYRYTHAPGAYGDVNGRGAIDEFWLDRRAGFCEHFAAALVYVLRSMGIPSRVVTGYQGTDEQLQDGWLVVRQLNAHAWVEVWVQGEGWIRVDPTASVAPERVEQGLAPRPVQGLVGSVLNTFNPSLWPRIRSFWETAQMRWDRWVVHYSRGQQFDVLKRLGVTQPRWEHLVYTLIGLLVTSSLVGALWAWWDRRRRDPWERLQSDLRSRLRALGIDAQAHETLRTLAHRVREQLGDEGANLAAELLRLERQRYAEPSRSKPDPGWWRRFCKAANTAQRRVQISGFASSMTPDATNAR